MILDKVVKVSISYRNISYYRDKNYDVGLNRTIEVSIGDVNPNSQVKIKAMCDVCKLEVFIPLYKYNKSFFNGLYYSCKNCSHTKLNRDNHKLSESIKKSKKLKYDKITEEIEKNGFIICKKCDTKNDLGNFRKNKNGRYLKVCSECRKKDFKKYYNNLSVEEKRYRKRVYYKNSITQNLWRSILRSYLFRKSLTKLDDTISILEYTSNDLKSHLESKFQIWMNWDNYGVLWQVDHIIPVSFFKECAPISIVNSLDNLRPLDKSYNLSRGNILDTDGYILFEQFETYIKEEYIKMYKNK
jgi:hypothetical protein